MVKMNTITILPARPNLVDLLIEKAPGCRVVIPMGSTREEQRNNWDHLRGLAELSLAQLKRPLPVGQQVPLADRGGQDA